MHIDRPKLNRGGLPEHVDADGRMARCGAKQEAGQM